jgi:heavy metal translocating P-type ATPase
LKHRLEMVGVFARRVRGIARAHPRPFAMLGLLLVSLALDAVVDSLGDPLALLVIAIGSEPLVRRTLVALRQRRYALDYLALLAIAAALATTELQVGAVIALMLASGQALEDYGVGRARSSLSLLADRIPRSAVVIGEHGSHALMPVEEITVGSTILVRHGEVLPLDGELLSEQSLVDESSLTGEPYLLQKTRGDEVRSGTVNQGPPLSLLVCREARDSTYRQILALVDAAQDSAAPMVRLADRYSLVFSAFAIALAGAAWWWSGSLERALAVLVVATPCPLILAVPIALVGGVNRAAREKIIVKRLAALEVLARVAYLVLDKTGTITVGRPELTRIEPGPTTPSMDSEFALTLTAAVERHSLHPIAKALVEAARARALPTLPVFDVVETGQEISARVDGRMVRVHGAEAPYGELRVVCEINGRRAATFVLEDRLKAEARLVIARILGLGVDLAVATGDRRAAAEHVVRELGLPLRLEAECTPAHKLELIRAHQAMGKTVGMVGDGINDAPALAQADVGLVFAHEARTASSEAADIVLLGGEIQQVWQALSIARQTIRVATQGILLGIGLSAVAMLTASAGLLPPLMGAFLQEGIDVLVIMNALRATAGSFPARQAVETSGGRERTDDAPTPVSVGTASKHR